LTFIAVCVCASPATLTDDRGETRRPWLPLALGIAVLAGLGGWGALRLQRTPTEYVNNVRLRIMQPNLQQDVRFNYAARQQVMERYISLSEQASDLQSRGVHDASILIWPESPFPFVLTHEPAALAQIAKLLSPSTVLITGAIRVEQTNSATAPRAYNDIYVIGSDGAILDKYDKTHLVPFGEYLPFENFLEKLGLQNLTKQAGGFTPGDHRHLITVPGAPVALPLICYEVVFPGAVAPPGDRAGWIVNVTNDGWFGISTGPYEHFQQSRVQAIEEGLPLVRAANTGVSAVVDPLGRVVNSLALGREGVIDSQLPRPIAAPPYARVGDAPALAMVVLGLLAALRGRFFANVHKA
jgi:apolipoprotein N-acyltransferase